MTRLARLAPGVVVWAAILGSLALVQTMIRGSQIMSGTVTSTQLSTTGVTPATYGDATHIGAVTVDAAGRITAASNVAVSGLPATSATGDLLASNGSAFGVLGVGSNGQVLTADSTQTRGVKWAAASGGGSAIAASVYNATNQTLTNGTESTLAFDLEDYDASGMHDPVTNNSRLTVPSSDGGVYRITARVKFTTAFSGAVHLRIYKNGTLVTENTAAGADLASGNEYHQVSADLSLAAADYVECKVLVELSAGSGTVSTVSGSGNTQFQAGALVAGVPAGSLVLLESHTASSSASLDFTTRNAVGQAGATFQSDFDDYLIEFGNVLPATNSTSLYLRMSTDGGATFDATSGHYAWGGFFSVSNVSATQGVDSTTQIVLAQSIGNTAADGGTGGSYHLYNPLSATANKLVTGQAANKSTTNSARPATQDYSGYYLSTTAMNACRILMSSGNIASGTVRIYGVAK